MHCLATKTTSRRSIFVQCSKVKKWVFVTYNESVFERIFSLLRPMDQPCIAQHVSLHWIAAAVKAVAVITTNSSLHCITNPSNEHESRVLALWLVITGWTAVELHSTLCLQECVSDDIEYLPNLASLGVPDPMPIEERAWYYLLRYRKYNFYEPMIGEFPEPEHPPCIQFWVQCVHMNIWHSQH